MGRRSTLQTPTNASASGANSCLGAPEQPAENGVRVTVKDWVYRGDHVELLVEPGPLRVQVTPDVRPPAGEALWLELPIERLEVLAD